MICVIGTGRLPGADAVFLCFTSMDDKHLLPPVDFCSKTAEAEALREKTQRLLMRFNTTGDASVLPDVFEQSMEGVTIYPPLFCNFGGHFVRFGRNVVVNFACLFQSGGGITIGDNVLIGSGVKIYTPNHLLDPEQRVHGKAVYRPVHIASDVWIGGGAILLPGVEIGQGTTIGAGSVVTRSIPPRCVAVGNPCRVIRRL